MNKGHLKYFEGGFPIEALRKAREKYLESEMTPPRQFNISLSKSYGWDCEFTPTETCWTEGFTRWIEGEDALNLFFSLDNESINLDSFEDAWVEE